MTNLFLPAQGHHELAEPVVDCEVDHSPGHPADVVLTASISDGPGKPIFRTPKGDHGHHLGIPNGSPGCHEIAREADRVRPLLGWLKEAKAQSQS